MAAEERRILIERTKQQAQENELNMKFKTDQKLQQKAGFSQAV